jgi:branched-chain amino acid aminotransferase
MRNYQNPPMIAEDEAVARLKALPRPWAQGYYAMYSSWFDGFVREPWLMSVPLDDHVVHRGDGVFEMSKCVGGRIYQLDRHLERLARSAQAIQLELPTDLGAMKRLAVAVIKAGGHADSALRIYVTRGPGGFTTNPRECPEAGVYVIASVLHTPKPQAYENGVRIGVSSVPSKSGFYASVKSCNYLPNVLLKSEAVRRGWDYAIGLDEDGNLAEGSTENMGLVDREGRLLLPPPAHILEGTTARRAKELAREMVAQGLLKSVENRTLTVDDLRAASEVMLLGTTLDVLPATRLEDEPLGGGQVGPVAKELLRRMRDDVANNPAVSTPAF